MNPFTLKTVLATLVVAGSAAYGGFYVSENNLIDKYFPDHSVEATEVTIEAVEPA
jgi:hypothetical protein